MRSTMTISPASSTVGAADQRLLAALENGSARVMNKADWKRIRREGIKLAESRTGRTKC